MAPGLQSNGTPVPPLCEGCGYHLEGLAHPGREQPAAPAGAAAAGGPDDWQAGGGRCPECGRPIWASLAARRVGSRWQRGPGLGSWMATNAAMLWSPLRVLAEVRTGAGPDRHASIARRRSYALLGANALTGGIVALAPWLIVLAADGSGTGAAPYFLLGGAWTFVAAWTVAVLILSEIERIGLGFFGRQRGWRVSRAVSLTVVAHASAGWVVGGVLVGALALFEGLVRRGPNWLDVPVLGDLLPVNVPLLPFAAFFAGMLVFETLTFVGVRRLRYAND